MKFRGGAVYFVILAVSALSRASLRYLSPDGLHRGSWRPDGSHPPGPDGDRRFVAVHGRRALFRSGAGDRRRRRRTDDVAVAPGDGRRIARHRARPQPAQLLKLFRRRFGFAPERLRAVESRQRLPRRRPRQRPRRHRRSAWPHPPLPSPDGSCPGADQAADDWRAAACRRRPPPHALRSRAWNSSSPTDIYSTGRFAPWVTAQTARSSRCPWGTNCSTREIARRAEVAGAGTRLPASRLRPDRLRGKIHQAMARADGARRIADAFAAAGGAGAAADAVETRLLGAVRE